MTVEVEKEVLEMVVNNECQRRWRRVGLVQMHMMVVVAEKDGRQENIERK